MSDTLHPRTYAAEVEAAAIADGWTVRHLSETDSGPRPWFQRAAKNGTARATLYFSSGIHGDEIAGPLALLELLRQPTFFVDFDVTIFPILNPDGLEKGIRENGAGIDLNRDYRACISAEIASHVTALKTLGRFDAAMMMHEDYEGIGAYLFELNDMPPPTLGTKLINAMRRHVMIDEREVIDEFPASGGILSRKDIIAIKGPLEDRPDWAEAAYLSIFHTQVSYTTETPKPFPLAHRVQAQIAAVQALLDSFAPPSVGG